MVDKIVDYLSDQEINFFYSLLQKKGKIDYKKAQESYTFFMPFVGRNIKLITEKAKEKLDLKPDELKILTTDIFEITLRKTIFNETSVGDEWFFNKIIKKGEK